MTTCDNIQIESREILEEAMNGWGIPELIQMERKRLKSAGKSIDIRNLFIKGVPSNDLVKLGFLKQVFRECFSDARQYEMQVKVIRNMGHLDLLCPDSCRKMSDDLCEYIAEEINFDVDNIIEYPSIDPLDNPEIENRILYLVK